MRPASLSRSNLPADVTSFIGRREELTRATELLGTTRLLTVTGAGGCGKTRLALELGRRAEAHYRDGVWWTDLGPLSDGDLVLSTVAAALGIQEIPLTAPKERLLQALRDQELLLLIDNCEHVLTPLAALVAWLLHGCPGISVLATSREPLGVEGETAWKVPSMAVPSRNAAPNAIGDSDAVSLFVDRAMKAHPSFHLDESNAPIVAEICARLDGIPLAIELAAARIRVMSPTEIARALDDRFRLLAGGARTAIARQQTLLASVDWSYQLLTATEKLLLQRLSVFSGSFSLSAAEFVCGGDETLPTQLVFDTLIALVDRSLVQVEHEEGSTRYRLLETIRQYASQKLLDTDEAGPIRDRHLSFFTGYAESLQRVLEGGPNSAETLTTIDRDYKNLRSAMEWARASIPELGARIARSLWIYWWTRGLWREGSQLCEAAAQGVDEPGRRSRALSVAAALATSGMDGVRARELGERAFALATTSDDVEITVESLYVKAASSFFTQPDVARPLLEEAMAKLGNARNGFWATRCLYGMGIVESTSGHLAASSRLLREVLGIHHAAGDRLLLAWISYWATIATAWAGEMNDFDALADESLAALRELGSPPLECGTLLAMGLAALLKGDPEQAAGHLRECREVYDKHPDPLIGAGLGLYEGMLFYLSSGSGGSDQGLQESLAFFDAGGINWLGAQVLAVMAAIARVGGSLDEARSLAADSLQRARSSRNVNSLAVALRAEANVAIMEEDYGKAEGLHYESLPLFLEAGAMAGILDALDSVACMLGRDERWEESARIFGGVDALRRELHLHRYEVDLPGFAEILGSLTSALGSRWDVLREEGARPSLDELVAYATRGRGERRRPASGWSSLTPAETDVVRLVAQGLTNSEIGRRLFIAPGTVKNHLSHVFSKLGISSRAELAAEAARRAAKSDALQNL